LLWLANFSEIFMKYNFSKEWCEKMARAEAGYEITAGTKELEKCPTCRGSELEKSWCETCARTGVVLVPRDISSVAP
jgi:DnaJ-class molecular chaperone